MPTSAAAIGCSESASTAPVRRSSSIVELRTALSWFGVELTILETAVIGSATVLAVLAWAVWPQDGDANEDSSRLG